MGQFETQISEKIGSLFKAIQQFITTSAFSNGAIEYANSIDSRIILIDGDRLSSLMVDHDVGVSTTGSYEIKRIDTDYFDE